MDLFLPLLRGESYLNNADLSTVHLNLLEPVSEALCGKTISVLPGSPGLYVVPLLC